MGINGQVTVDGNWLVAMVTVYLTDLPPNAKPAKKQADLDTQPCLMPFHRYSGPRDFISQ